MNDGATGVYTVSTKIYSMIKALINALVMVTVPRFSYYLAHNMTERYKKTLSRIADSLIIITLPVIIGLFLEAHKILELVAGTNYFSGESVVKILSIAIFFATMSCFFSYGILLPNRLEKYFLLSTTVAAIVNISLNLLFIPLFGINGAALTTLLAEVIVFTITAACSYKTIIFKISKKNTLTVLIASVLLYLVCICIDRINLNEIILLALDIIIGAIVYLGVLLITNNSIVKKTIVLLNNKTRNR